MDGGRRGLARRWAPNFAAETVRLPVVSGFTLGALSLFACAVNFTPTSCQLRLSHFSCRGWVCLGGGGGLVGTAVFPQTPTGDGSGKGRPSSLGMAWHGMACVCVVSVERYASMAQ